MANMMKALKQMQKMQADMARLQDELAEKTVTATAGGGAITATVTGAQQVASIKIDPEVIVAEDAEMLEDLVRAAVNEGLRLSQEMVATEMEKITGGLKIPGLI